MSHYAYVNPYTHIVEKVLVIDQEMINSGEFGDPENFVSCSHEGNTCFPGIGYHYLSRSFNSKVKVKNCFLPPCPNPNFYFNTESWTWGPERPVLISSSLKNKIKNFLLDFFHKT